MPTNKGKKFPPEPLPVEDVVRMIEACKPQLPGRTSELVAMRDRALIITLWRTGLRISEAMDLEDRDLSRANMSILVRHGKGDKRRIVVMDEWGWRELDHWNNARANSLPRGAVFCVVRGSLAGEHMSTASVRQKFRTLTRQAGLTRRGNPHSFRHGFAVEAKREGVDFYALQQQLGHARLDITAAYFRSIDPMEVLNPLVQRAAPLMPLPSFH